MKNLFIYQEILEIRKKSPNKFVDAIGNVMKIGDYVAFANGSITTSVGILVGGDGSKNITGNVICYIASNINIIQRKSRGVILLDKSNIPKSTSNKYKDVFQNCFLDKIIEIL